MTNKLQGVSATLALGIAALGAMQASAAPITYTLSGDFSGTLDGASVDMPIVFTGIGNTNTLADGGYYQSVTLSSLTAVAGGVTYVLAGDYHFFNNQGTQVAGFSHGATDGTDIIDFGSTAFGSYWPDTAIGPIEVSYKYLNAIPTDHGTFALAYFLNGSFTASVGTVPEPASWALMLGGFGLIGGALRSRRKAAVLLS